MARRIFILLFILIGITACKETIQVDEFSKDLKYERSIAVPLVKLGFIFEDVANRDADSIATIGGDTIKFFYPQEIELHDTIARPTQGENMVFDYFYLYHTITNMFPVGLDLQFLLYDSTTNQNIDTISFGGDASDAFLVPAAVGADSLVIEGDIQTYTDALRFTESNIDNYFEASDVVVRITMPPTPGIIRILSHYELMINLGIDAKGTIIKESEEETN